MIYEFRTYEATPGNLPALNKHLEVAAGLFKKHGLGVMGFWTEEVGTGGQVNYRAVFMTRSIVTRDMVERGGSNRTNSNIVGTVSNSTRRSRSLVRLFERLA